MGPRPSGSEQAPVFPEFMKKKKKREKVQTLPVFIDKRKINIPLDFGQFFNSKMFFT